MAGTSLAAYQRSWHNLAEAVERAVGHHHRPACKTRHQTPNPGRQRPRPRQLLRQTWQRGPGPGTPRSTPHWPAG